MYVSISLRLRDHYRYILICINMTLYCTIFKVLFTFIVITSLILATQSGAGKASKQKDQIDELDPSFFMATESHFPDHPFQQFVSGEVANVLIGFHNLWKHPVTVFGISGAYYTPDHAHVFRNITQQKTYAKVMPQEQNTFHFNLKPEMEASHLVLVLNVDFTDSSERKWYRAVAVNRTIEIVPSVDSLFDAKSIFIYILFVAMLIGFFYLVRDAFFPSSSKKSNRSSKLFDSLSNAFYESLSSGSARKTPNTGSQTSLKSSGDEDEPWTSLPSEWLPKEHIRRSASPNVPLKRRQA